MKTFLSVAAALLLMVAGAFLFWLYQEKVVKKPTALITPTPTELPKMAVFTTAPLPSDITNIPEKKESDIDLLKQAMAKKHNKSLADVDLSINKNTGVYAIGSVKFQGDVGGGWWLAAQKGSEWVIVADGNGTVMCQDIAPYNFPTDMVPECWDTVNNKLIKR